ncbi:MAG: hypothetical protein ABEJ83_00540 [Candidatus Nanohaloarchaea archaeon]
MVIGILIILGVFLVIGLGLQGGKAGVARDLAKARLKRFVGEVEYGCKIGESVERTFTYGNLQGINKVRFENGKYVAVLQNGKVSTPPKECDNVKICSSGSGYSCSPGGVVQVDEGGTKVKVFHDFQGGNQNISVKDVS